LIEVINLDYMHFPSFVERKLGRAPGTKANSISGVDSENLEL
jgi:hypothetical protein